MKKLLIVVDYQKDFVDGALGFKGAEKIEDEIIKLIHTFRDNNDDVVFTMDTHQKDYMETTEGAYLPVPHCIEGSDGWMLTKNLQPLVKDSLVFKKPGFPSIELGKFIDEHKNKYDEIHLCGLVSDICVFSNAIIAKASANVKAKIIVHRNATTSFDLEIQEKSFDILKHLHIEVR